MVNRSGSHWIFQLIRPGAREVYLVGDFNGWSCGATPMTRNSAGLWEQVLVLPPGVYRFRYYADGQWLTDYAAYGVQRNPLGDFDSVLLVEAPSAGQSATTMLLPQSASALRTPLRRSFRRNTVKTDLPPAASGRHVALAAARQRRLAGAPPVGIERIITIRSDDRRLAEV